MKIIFGAKYCSYSRGDTYLLDIFWGNVFLRTSFYGKKIFDDYYLVLGVTFTLALRGEACCQLGHFLPVKGVTILAVNELWLVLVLLL